MKEEWKVEEDSIKRIKKSRKEKNYSKVKYD